MHTGFYSPSFPRVPPTSLLQETNKAADLLVKLGHSQCDPFVYYVAPPLDIMDVLSADSNTVICTHLT